MRTMARSEKSSRKSWDFRRATIAFDSVFKGIELIANGKFSERQTLLWVVPLSLYLLSFILCFDHPRWYQRAIFQPLFALGIFVLGLTMKFALGTTQVITLPLLPSEAASYPSQFQDSVSGRCRFLASNSQSPASASRKSQLGHLQSITSAE